MEPLVFEPYLRPVVWGGRQLAERLGKRLPTDAAYGESWELSPHPQHVSRVAEGPLAGQPLDVLCRDSAADLFGPDRAACTVFPLLIKFLDCHQLLSIQVHPHDELARQLAEEQFGKTEAWLVLHAEPDAVIYAGFRSGVTRPDVERHLAAGTLEQTLHSFAPHAGDCLYLPAGTVHAVGGGVLMAEVQQASDATFRLHDWNRLGTDGKPRELHIEHALTAIDWNAGPVDPVTPRRQTTSEPAARVEQLVASTHFGMQRVTLHGGSGIAGRSGAEVWMIVDGSAKLQTATGYARVLRTGETVLIPAVASDPRWTPIGPGATLLRIEVPATPGTTR